VTQYGIEEVTVNHARVHIDEAKENLPLAILAQVQSTLGNPSGDGGANVQEVPITICPRPEHRVGVADGVGFSPGDLLAKPWGQVSLVGGAAPRRHASHLGIRLGLPDRLGGKILVDPEPGPVLQIERSHVKRGRNADLTATGRQGLGELQAAVAEQAAPVDVGLGHVHQFGRPADLRHAHDDPHGHLGGLTRLARQ